MAYNAAQIDFGQAGGAYLNDTDAYTPPTGKVIAYIEVVAANTTFDTLTPSNDTGSNTYHLGTTVVAAATGNGANAVALSSENFAVFRALSRSSFSCARMCLVRGGRAR